MENKNKPECHGANVGGPANSQTTVILPPEKIHWVPHPPQNGTWSKDTRI